MKNHFCATFKNRALSGLVESRAQALSLCSAGPVLSPGLPRSRAPVLVMSKMNSVECRVEVERPRLGLQGPGLQLGLDLPVLDFQSLSSSSRVLDL